MDSSVVDLRLKDQILGLKLFASTQTVY